MLMKAERGMPDAGSSFCQKYNQGFYDYMKYLLNQKGFHSLEA